MAPPRARPEDLPPALPGERFVIDGGPAGRIACYSAGPARSELPPLVLVHSVNAAASAAEMRPLYVREIGSRRVFAPDLPGFGASERSRRPYTPRLMTDALHAVLGEVAARCGPQPADLLALSLGCEFAVRAAVEAPRALRTLSLVSPTGFAGTRPRHGAPGGVVGPAWAERLVRGPGWGGPLFRALTRPGVIRYFLRRTWGAHEIDEDLWRCAVQTAQVEGAEHAPLAFLAARLFSADIGTLVGRLTLPVWVSHGVRGDFTDYRGLAALQGRPNWRVSVYETGALPYFEQPEAFVRELDAFLAA
ncbi:MAG: alpha/beta hydrolase [Rubrivivax sp.]|nr:alpha/beta hydrolase [Rubrivivax sp.]